MGIEHDLMHLETLCYMLAQRTCSRYIQAVQSEHAALVGRNHHGSAADSLTQEPRGASAGPEGTSAPFSGVTQGTAFEGEPDNRSEVLRPSLRFKGCPDGRFRSGEINGLLRRGDGGLPCGGNRVQLHVPGPPVVSAKLGDPAAQDGGWGIEYVEVPEGVVAMGVPAGTDDPFVWDLEGPPQVGAIPFFPPSSPLAELPRPLQL